MSENWSNRMCMANTRGKIYWHGEQNKIIIFLVYIYSQGDRKMLSNSTFLEDSPPPFKAFLEHSSSQQTLSTINSRFTRKPDQRLSKRSTSRHSSDRSLGLEDISGFYIKMSDKKPNEQPISPRKNIIQRGSQLNKSINRSPTPLPGHVKRKPQKNSNQAFQANLAIAELQKQCQQQRSAKERIQKRCNIMEKELKVKLLKIQELQQFCRQKSKSQEEYLRKLEQYQKLAATHETNFNQARNSLQKLKNMMKQTKYAQLQSDNQKLRQENTCLREQLEQCISKMQEQQSILNYQQKQIDLLRRMNEKYKKENCFSQKDKQIDILKAKLQLSKTKREDQLQQTIAIKTRDITGLTTKLQKLQIQLNYMNRKRNEEIIQLRQTKNSVIYKLRDKLSHLYKRFSEVTSENECLRNNRNPMFSSMQIERPNLMSHISRNDDLFVLDLSP